MPDWAEHVIVVLFAWTAVAALSVTIPQGCLFFHLVQRHSPATPYTLKTILWTGTIGVLLLWRSLVFADTLLFEGRFFGPIQNRWMFELFLALLFVGAVNYAAILYHWTVTFRRGGRGTTGVPREPAHMKEEA
jgi:hypothetical protein